MKADMKEPDRISKLKRFMHSSPLFTASWLDWPLSGAVERLAVERLAFALARRGHSHPFSKCLYAAGGHLLPRQGHERFLESRIRNERLDE
jgi:hypothetical protein